MGRLARHFGNDRFLVAAEAGYMARSTFNEVDPGPDRRERFTTDVTAFFDLLPHPHQALRLGAGNIRLDGQAATTVERLTVAFK